MWTCVPTPSVCWFLFSLFEGNFMWLWYSQKVLDPRYSIFLILFIFCNIFELSHCCPSCSVFRRSGQIKKCWMLKRYCMMKAYVRLINSVCAFQGAEEGLELNLWCNLKKKWHRNIVFSFQLIVMTSHVVTQPFLNSLQRFRLLLRTVRLLLKLIFST